MPSSKAYLEYILEQLSETDGITFRPMMGEYVLYCKGKLIGGIYDDRLLLKPTKGAVSMTPDAALVLPYDGGREMLQVENLEDREFLRALTEAVYRDLPEPKKRRGTS